MRTWLRSLLMPRSLLGLALFVLPWLWVLGAFAPRNLFIKQVTGNTYFPPTVPWAGSLPYPYGYNSQIPRNVGIPASFETDFINDPQVQAKSAEQTAQSVDPPNPGAPKPAELNAYQSLIKRFPRESWLYAHYLRVAVGSFDDGRLAGAFSSAATLSPYANAPESTGFPPSFSPQQLDAALKIARQGQVLERNNAFFGLYEGVLLWMGHRDEEAWHTLHRASLLPHYDDHTNDDIQATLKVAQLQYGPFLWEQQMISSVIVVSPQHARLREKARQWSWAAWKLERAGHHHDAITKCADLARLFGKTVHGRNTLIDGFTGAAMQATMWSGNPNRKVNTRQMTSQQRANAVYRSHLYAQKFADYARAHGESALAAETVRLGQATGQFRALASAAIDYTTPYNMPHALVYQTRALWWTACELLGSGILVCVAWLTTSILLIGAGGEPARARFIFPIVGLCVALCALIYHKYSGPLTVELVTFFGMVPSPDTSHLFEVWQGIALSLPVALPALASSSLTSLGMLRGRRATRRSSAKSNGPQSSETTSDPAQNATPSSHERAHLPRDMRPLVWTFLLWCALLGALGGWIFAIALWINPLSVLPIGRVGNVETLTLEVVILAALSSALWLAGWIVKWRFFASATERPFTHSALRRFNTTLGVLLIVGSWSYALVLYASLAPRLEADRLAALELQLGEIGVLEAKHAQAAKTHKSKP